MDNMERDEVTEQEYDDPMVDYYYEQSKRQSLVRTHPEWFEDNVQSIRSWGFAESRVIMLADVVMTLEEEAYEEARERRARGENCLICPCCRLARVKVPPAAVRPERSLDG